MELRFALRGVVGRVAVTYGCNLEPESLGCQPETRGFPVCTATVHYPMRGYDAVMGWVQLVRSDDNASGGEQFEVDPLAFLGDVPHPFCWIGVNPTLFDAPSRSPRSDLQWTARSYLCVPDDGGEELEVRAMLGFSWGFRVQDEEIALEPPRELPASAWNEHRSVLRDRYPGWRFPRDFADLG